MGHVASEPFEFSTDKADKGAHHAVEIVMDLKLKQGVTLDELRAAVPDLQHAQRPIDWSPVTPEQWAVIRELMRFHNPKLDDKLPAAMAPAVRRIEVEPPQFSGSKVAGEAAQVRFRLHNRGNTTWLGDEQIRIAGIWRPLEPSAPAAAAWEWTLRLHDAVPPGGAVEFGDLEAKLPGEAGERQIDWTVEGVGWQPPAEPVTLRSTLTVEPVKTAQPPQPAVPEEQAKDGSLLVQGQELLDKARSAEQGGDYGEAIRLYQQLLQILERLGDQGRMAEVTNHLSQVLREQGDLDQARNYAQQSLEIRQRSGDQAGMLDSLRALGLIALEQHDGNAAISYFQQAIEINSKDVASFLDLGDAYLAANRVGEGLKAYQRAAALDPKNARAQQGLGTAYQSQGNSDKAEVAFRRAIALQPDNAHAYLPLGDLYVEFNDYGRAVATLQKAVETAPKDVFVRSRLAQLYYRLGRLEEARTAFMACLTSSKEDGDLQGVMSHTLSLADIAEDQGDYGAASKRREESLQARVELQAQGKEVLPWLQFWLLATPETATWLPGLTVTWSDARRPDEQANLRSAQEGDLVLLIDPSNQSLVGSGRIANKSSILDASRRGRRQAVDLMVEERFPASISRDELGQALPRLQVVNRTSSFSPVTPAQWTVIRTWIVFRNPTLATPSLPQTDVLPQYRFEVVNPPAPEQLTVGSIAPASISLRNLGNGVWTGDTSFRVVADWYLRDRLPVKGVSPGDSVLSYSQEMTAAVGVPIPPGALVTLKPVQLQAPETPGKYGLVWTVSSLDWTETVAAPPTPVQPVTITVPETPAEPGTEPPPAEPATETLTAKPVITRGFQAPPPLRPATAADLTQLRLDAAVPERVQVGAPFELAISVRHPNQPPLKPDALPQTRSGESQVELPEDMPTVQLRAEVISQQCDIQGEFSVTFRLPPRRPTARLLFPVDAQGSRRHRHRRAGLSAGRDAGQRQRPHRSARSSQWGRWRSRCKASRCGSAPPRSIVSRQKPQNCRPISTRTRRPRRSSSITTSGRISSDRWNNHAIRLRPAPWTSTSSPTLKTR